MNTATYDGPSRVELQLLLRRAAVGDAREHGRQRAERTRTTLMSSLTTVAAVLALYDVALLVAA